MPDVSHRGQRNSGSILAKSSFYSDADAHTKYPRRIATVCLFIRLTMPFTRKHVPCCRVPGCTADLFKQKLYNLRCRICRYHQGSKHVFIEGWSHRYCHQCACLHPIRLFAGEQESCVDSLEKRQKRKRSTETTKVRPVINGDHAPVLGTPTMIRL